MDWIEPYVLLTLGCHAVVVLGFVLGMLVTGRRHRATTFPGAAEVAAPPGVPDPALSYEELGFLAGGDRRVTEVALLRLCLSGHVKVDGLLTLVRDPDLPEGLPENLREDEDGPSARTALLRELRRRRQVQLAELLAAGERTAVPGVLPRRLVELGLVDPSAGRVLRTRERLQGWYAGSYLLTLVAFVLAGAIGASGTGPGVDRVSSAVVAVGVFLAGVYLSGFAVRISGGELSPVTPAGRAVLAGARDDKPEPADNRLLHWVALHGLDTVPEFRKAEEHCDPEAGLEPRTKATRAVTDLVLAIAELLAGAGGRQR